MGIIVVVISSSKTQINRKTKSMKTDANMVHAGVRFCKIMKPDTDTVRSSVCP